MTSDKWAKLFEVNGQQVLFYFEKTQEVDSYDIHQITEHNGECVDILLRNVPARSLKKTFGEIDEEYAKTALRVIREIVEDYDKRKSA
jgi:hypothetical protein